MEPLRAALEQPAKAAARLLHIASCVVPWLLQKRAGLVAKLAGKCAACASKLTKFSNLRGEACMHHKHQTALDQLQGP